ncbi:MAG: hypothetical protein LBD25_06270 [Coriobacteriales bacterium]|jgi:hypothetical protein|nr:hypothetical protein [Coriobacteriales bacterium]
MKKTRDRYELTDESQESIEKKHEDKMVRQLVKEGLDGAWVASSGQTSIYRDPLFDVPAAELIKGCCPSNTSDS